MAFGLDDLHTPKNVQELERVEILPYDRSRTANSGTFTMPDGLTWADFDEGVTAVLSIGGAWHNEQTVSAEQISKVAGDYLFRVSYSTSSADYIVRIYKDSDTTGSWSIPASSSTNASLLHIYGTKRKYSTTPISRTIDLGTISINETYVLLELDIGAEFFNDDGTLKDSVNATVQIYNDGSGGGETIWGEVGWINRGDALGFRGVAVAKGSDRLVVNTGDADALFSGNSNVQPHPFGVMFSNTTTAPARLIISMGERYAPTIAP